MTACSLIQWSWCCRPDRTRSPRRGPAGAGEVALVLGTVDAPLQLRAIAVGLARRLVCRRGVERTITICPHLAAVVAVDHGEIADRLGIGCCGERNPALDAFPVAVRRLAGVISLVIVERHAVEVDERGALLGQDHFRR